MKSLLLGFILLSGNAFAGDKGNGGISLVCRNDKNEILSAELLDIYEGRILGGKTFSEVKNIEKKLNDAVSKISSIQFKKMVSENISYVQANMIFIPKGHELLPTDDALPMVKKEGCKFEQLANFTNDGDLYVSSEIYEQLDSLNRAALILHEAVYATRRELGDQNSQKSRRLVYELMSDDTNMPVMKRLIRPSELNPGMYLSDYKEGCYTVLSEDGWSFSFQKRRRRFSCGNEVVTFVPTEHKNIFRIVPEGVFFEVTGKDTFRSAFQLDWLIKGQGSKFKREK